MFYAAVEVVWISAQLLLALLAADFGSGLLHWFQDRYIQTDWPVLGNLVAEPNELHHQAPRAFTKDGFLQRNWASIAVACTLLLIFSLIDIINWFTGGFIVASALLPTQAHYWAHRTRKENGLLVTTLQKFGVLQSSRHHWRHHRGAKDNYFCTMTNYVNPILEIVKFFKCLEKLIRVAFRIKPKHNTY